MRNTLGLAVFAVVMMIIASAYIRTNGERPGALEPAKGDISIRCTTETAEPVVFIDQPPACPTKRQQQVEHLRTLYHVHLEEVRCG